jgi:hypothetical protein
MHGKFLRLLFPVEKMNHMYNDAQSDLGNLEKTIIVFKQNKIPSGKWGQIFEHMELLFLWPGVMFPSV